MKLYVDYLAVTLGLLLVAAPAGAQTDSSRQTNSEPTAEITPYVSLGSVGSSRIGAAIRFPWTAGLSAEIETGYRGDEINAISSNVSVVYDLPRIKRLAPYVASGIGIEQYGMAVAAPGIGLVTQRKIAFTVNAGGGVRVPVDDNWGVRTDARWFNGLGRDAGEHWRLYNGVTFSPRIR